MAVRRCALPLSYAPVRPAAFGGQVRQSVKARSGGCRVYVRCNASHLPIERTSSGPSGLVRGSTVRLPSRRRGAGSDFSAVRGFYRSLPACSELEGDGRAIR